MHHHQAKYMLQQHYELAHLQNTTAQTYQQKLALYMHTTKTTRQYMYFIRKRVRDDWDPTLWEVPISNLAHLIQTTKNCIGMGRKCPSLALHAGGGPTGLPEHGTDVHPYEDANGTTSPLPIVGDRSVHTSTTSRKVEALEPQVPIPILLWSLMAGPQSSATPTVSCVTPTPYQVGLVCTTFQTPHPLSPMSCPAALQLLASLELVAMDGEAPPSP